MNLSHKYKLIILLLGFSLGAPAYAVGIKKCQDETGQWHYGDRAAIACERSKIIEMSRTGYKTGEVEAPPTDDELAEFERKKEETAKQEKLAKAQQRKDDLLLSTYGHENDIIYVRDRKLSQIEKSIEASKATLKSLRATLARQEKQKDSEENIKRTFNQIVRHQGVIDMKRKEQDTLRAQYETELTRYRVLKAKNQ
ncbi:MAG: hypothetical protein BMS9Abin33_0099 [Gammaproteobacteria bacterium]|nr:MAG: hypothetical protein BMS9Abin33_0099 [Gammaproteobacteria bacterium]